MFWGKGRLPHAWCLIRHLNTTGVKMISYIRLDIMYTIYSTLVFLFIATLLCLICRPELYTFSSWKPFGRKLRLRTESGIKLLILRRRALTTKMVIREVTQRNSSLPKSTTTSYKTRTENYYKNMAKGIQNKFSSSLVEPVRIGISVHRVYV